MTCPPSSIFTCLHRDGVLAAVPVLAQSLDLGRVGARQIGARSLMCFELRELVGNGHAFALPHQCEMHCCHLDCQHTLDPVPRGNVSDDRREETSRVCRPILGFRRLERCVALQEKSLIHSRAFTAEDFVQGVFAVLRKMQGTIFVLVEGEQIIFGNLSFTTSIFVMHLSF